MFLADLMLDVFNAGFDLSIMPDKRNRSVSLVLSKGCRQSAAKFFVRDLQMLAVSPRGTSPELEAKLEGLIASLEENLEDHWLRQEGSLASKA